MHVEFEGKVIYWRGPVPYFYVPVPKEHSDAIKDLARQVSYGWGVIPVAAQLGNSEWFTSLFPKDGLYLVPIKDTILKTEKVTEGQPVSLRLEVGARKHR